MKADLEKPVSGLMVILPKANVVIPDMTGRDEIKPMPSVLYMAKSCLR